MGPWNEDISCTDDLNYPSDKSSLPNNIILALKYILRLGNLHTALIPTSLPEINVTGHGMLALRQWAYSDGWLRSINSGIIWREQMIADKPPTRENSHGLYGIEFSPESLMWGVIENWERGKIFGLIQVRGKFVIHSDCILRAEFARIICIFVLPDSYTNERVSALTRNYPNTPVYVLHKKQIAELLFRELNRRRETQND